MHPAPAADTFAIPGSFGRYLVPHDTRSAMRALKSVVLSLSAVTFAILLLVTFSTFTVPRYAYMGYSWDPNSLTIATGLASVAVTAFFLPVALSRASDIFIHLLFCMAFVPAQVLPSAYSPLTTNHILIFQVVVTVCFLALFAANRLPALQLNLKLLNFRGYEIMLLILTGIMIAPVLFYMGVPVALPGFGDVYTVRLNARESMAAAPFIVGYIFGFLTSVMIPLLVAYGVLRKRWWFLALGFIITLYTYGLTGQKRLLFSLALIALVYYGIRLFGRHLVTMIVPAAVMVVIVSRIVDWFIPFPYLTALFADRVFVTPGVLTGYYHEFFTLNEPGRWAYSFLGWAGEYEYDRTPPFLVGMEYFDRPALQANTHFLADGFANFGYLGMFLVTIITGCIIWFTNSLAVGRSLVFVTSLATMVLFSLGSDSVFTSLLTHGIGLALVLILLMPTDDSGKHEELRTITIRT